MYFLENPRIIFWRPDLREETPMFPLNISPPCDSGFIPQWYPAIRIPGAADENDVVDDEPIRKLVVMTGGSAAGHAG